MDEKTLQVYQKHSEKFISRYKKLKPLRLYELIATFFHQNAKTLDIGCASGRDLTYLKTKGYQVEGLGPISHFVKHCTNQYPNIPIKIDSLPKLEGEKDGKYQNIILNAVLMHLPSSELIESVSNILGISAVNGRILISLRR